jgi:hypothetical protein
MATDTAWNLTALQIVDFLRSLRFFPRFIVIQYFLIKIVDPCAGIMKNLQCQVSGVHKSFPETCRNPAGKHRS